MPDWTSGRPPWFPSEFDWVVGCTYRGMPTERARVRNVIGANMSFRRSVFAAAGGFALEMGRTGSYPLGNDDTEFCIRAHRALPDQELVFEPRARVLAHGSASAIQLALLPDALLRGRPREGLADGGDGAAGWALLRACVHDACAAPRLRARRAGRAGRRSRRSHARDGHRRRPRHHRRWIRAWRAEAIRAPGRRPTHRGAVPRRAPRARSACSPRHGARPLVSVADADRSRPDQRLRSPAGAALDVLRSARGSRHGLHTCAASRAAT